MRKQVLSLLTVIFLIQSAPALAAVAFTANDSFLQASAFASVGSPFAFQLDGPRSMGFTELGIPSTFGGSLLAEAMVSDSDGPSTANMTSMINVSITQSGGTVSVLMDLNYQTNAQASPGAGDFDSANAEGSALIQLSFNIDVAYAFTFTVFGAAAMGSPDLEFELRQPGLPDAFNATITNNTQDLIFSGMLAPGTDYEIVINVDDSNNNGAANGGSAIGLASFTGAELVLTPVPLPAGLYLLIPALGWLGLFRRR